MSRSPGTINPKSDPGTQLDRGEALRDRLRMISNHHSQNELARRTGVSKSNVHRYLKSGRIPGEWVQSVLERFGVNPSWLMLGRGEMFQSDVSTGAATEGSELLELAVKMNAVDHERLSALQGRDRARMVRELSDTLSRNDGLRKRMAERVGPVAEQLLREYGELSRSQRHDETLGILAALRQLDRLYDDWEFRALLDSVEAVECTFRGDYARNVELAMRIVGTRIAAGEMKGVSTMRAAVNACTGLVAEGRTREAGRLAKAMILLTGGEDPPTDEFHALNVPVAIMDIEDGHPTRGVATLTWLASFIPVSLEYFPQDLLLMGGFTTGVIPLKETFNRNSGLPHFSGALLLMALWERDLEALTRVQSLMEKAKVRPDKNSVRRKQYVDSVLRGEVPEAQPDGSPIDRFQDAVLRCEAACWAGRRRIASKAFREVEEAWRALGPKYLPRFFLRAMYMRQALDYGDQPTAEQWFRDRLREGYGCLRPFAKERGLVEKAANLSISIGRPEKKDAEEE